MDSARSAQTSAEGRRARLVRGDGGGSCGGSGEQEGSGYIQKIEQMRFIERFHVGCERKRGSRMIPRLLV